MNQELKDEMNYEIQLLIKSGFYSDEDILEIIGDEFIEENISDDEISKLFLENKENMEETSKIPQEWNQFYLKDVSFVNLMTRRIFNILIVANPYDAFMLEDDGRIDVVILNGVKDLYIYHIAGRV